MIRGMMGLIVAAPLAGAAIGGVASNLTGSLAGIGGATQSMIGVGLFGKAAELGRSMFKF